MKRNYFHLPKRAPCTANDTEAGFTLTELLVILATLAILAMMVLPALAGAHEKSGRVRCAANLRQLHVASMLYANNNNQWLPPWRAGQGYFENNLTAIHYSYFAANGPAKALVPRSPNLPSGFDFQNAGYLYGASLISDGKILFCPNFFSGPFASVYYSPLLTTDEAGDIRSSYNYNPRVINAGNSPGPVNTYRRYQKTTDFEAHKLFAVDVIKSAPFWSHVDERGFNVLFTDGSVHFSRIQDLAEPGSSYDVKTYDHILDLLETDR